MYEPEYPKFLERIYIAAPCNASWNSMQGDDRVRFCTGCSKSVYNLSSMTRLEAEAFLKENGIKVCLKFYRRADGTILTENCPVGLRKLRNNCRWLIRSVACVFSLLISTSICIAKGGKHAPTKKREVVSECRGPLGVPQWDVAEVETFRGSKQESGFNSNSKGTPELYLGAERDSAADETDIAEGRWKLCARLSENVADLPAFKEHSLAKQYEYAGSLEQAASHYFRAVESFREASYTVEVRRQIMADYANLLRKMKRFVDANEIDIGLYKERALESANDHSSNSD